MITLRLGCRAPLGVSFSCFAVASMFDASAVAQTSRLSLLSEPAVGARAHLGLSTTNQSLVYPLLFVSVLTPPVPVTLQGVPVLVDLATADELPLTRQWGANPGQSLSTSFKWNFDVVMPPIPVGTPIHLQAAIVGATGFDVSNGVTTTVQLPTGNGVRHGIYIGPTTFGLDEIDTTTGAVTNLLANQPVTSAIAPPSRSDDGRFVVVGFQLGGLYQGYVHDRVTGVGRALGVGRFGVGRFVFRPGDNQHVWSLERWQTRCLCGGSGTWWDYDSNFVCYDAATGAIVQSSFIDDSGTAQRPQWRSLTQDWTFDSTGQFVCFKSYEASWNNGIVELLILPVSPAGVLTMPPLGIPTGSGVLMNPGGSGVLNAMLALPGSSKVVVEAGGFGGVGGPSAQLCVVDVVARTSSAPFAGPGGGLRLAPRQAVAPNGNWFAGVDSATQNLVFLDGVTPVLPSGGLNILGTVPTTTIAQVCAFNDKAVIIHNYPEIWSVSPRNAATTLERVWASPAGNCSALIGAPCFVRVSHGASEGMLLTLGGGTATLLDVDTMTWASLQPGSPCGFAGALPWQILF